ncbi:zinc ABC transporter substrate-binding protein [Litoreibacter roseus]|uniref:High-affinity zinc uptake system protein ZnuA n=1 Tax=Litoreibacter roseus TaxID=2601869 RepID=A0A6N6JHD6_9RHOB|nr:zinc ABC transporter substrate-binding protein [Litoreibacter roseus]GFE64698.1 zinc transporter [Litoreibacter roseus]
MARISVLVWFLTVGTAVAEVPKVVTDIAPVHSLVASVMDGVGQPSLLLPAGASPHSHAMRPSDAQSLQDAAVVFWIGEALTPWLHDSLENLGENAQKVSLLDVPETIIHEAEDHSDHDHGHSHGPVDPHAWLDPQNAKIWLGEIARILSAADPEHDKIYEENALRAAAALEKIEADTHDQVSQVTGSIVVQHDALRYFEERFSVETIGAITNVDDAAPSAKRLKDLQGELSGDQPVCLIVPTVGGAQDIKGLDRDVQISQTDILGANLEAGPNLYADLLIDVAKAFTACGNI